MYVTQRNEIQAGAGLKAAGRRRQQQQQQQQQQQRRRQYLYAVIARIISLSEPSCALAFKLNT
jgi:transcription initiation factor TFIID subunit TAF12